MTEFYNCPFCNAEVGYTSNGDSIDGEGVVYISLSQDCFSYENHDLATDECGSISCDDIIFHRKYSHLRYDAKGSRYMNRYNKAVEKMAINWNKKVDDYIDSKRSEFSDSIPAANPEASKSNKGRL